MRHLFKSKRSCFASITWHSCVAIFLLPLLSGCSQFSGSLCDLGAPMARMKGDCRDERLARSAAKEIWGCKYEQCYINHCDPNGLRKGFIDGFVDASFGKTDCPPMFAPVSMGLFLHPKATCSMAWHNGYPMGQAAALSCGYQRNCCSRLHPCLRNYERPVNPGCVKIDDYQNGQQNQYSPGIPMEVITPAPAPIMPPIGVSATEPTVEEFGSVPEAIVTTDDTSTPNEMLVSFMNQPLRKPVDQTFVKANQLPTNRTSGMMEDIFQASATIEEVAPPEAIAETSVVENSVEVSSEPASADHWQSLPRTRSALGRLSTTFNWRSSLNP